MIFTREDVAVACGAMSNQYTGRGGSWSSEQVRMHEAMCVLKTRLERGVDYYLPDSGLSGDGARILYGWLLETVKERELSS